MTEAVLEQAMGEPPDERRTTLGAFALICRQAAKPPNYLTLG
jgi:hypothetical protein